MRDQLLAELASVEGADAAAQWAHRIMAVKNTLNEPDARMVEDAFALRLASFEAAPEATDAAVPSPPPDAALGRIAGPHPSQSSVLEPGGPHIPALKSTSEPGGIDKSALPIGNPRRYRDQAHLKFVAAQPCLLCGRKPCDPHHLRFAQKRALGRKVSDEFCVPLCRTHHRELHRSGDESLWWESAMLDPIKVARKLWRQTRLQRAARPARPGLGGAAATPTAQTVAHPAERTPGAAAPSPPIAERQ